MKNRFRLDYLRPGFLALITLSMVLNFIPSTTISACTSELDNQTNIANTVKTASYVFQGTVKELTLSQLIIEVSQYFKGNGPSTVTITPWDKNCGKPITASQEAIFFIKTDITQSAPSIITDQELIFIQPVSPEMITEITAQIDCMAIYHPEQGKVNIPCLAIDHGLGGIYSADLSLKPSESLLLSVDKIQLQEPFTTQQQVYIEQIDIQILKSLPISVQAVVTGQLSNPCQQIAPVEVARQDNTFNLTLTTTNSTPPEMDCPDVLVPFKEVIPLDVTGLKAGTYTVKVNGVSNTFELIADNIPSQQVYVEQVDIQILKSLPIQVQAVVTGQLSNPCQQIDPVEVARQDNTFNLTLTTTTSTPPEIDCPDVLVPFKEVIPLDVTGLKAGTYTVKVNGVSNTFELTADNIPFKALINHVDIQLLESFPVQVKVKVKGRLSNGCQQIDQIETTRIDNLFKVTITTTPPPPAEIACTMVLTAFEETIPLDVQGLKAGIYAVEVNGISNQFELAVDNEVN